ncbi:hypothetical protein [Actinoplanes sp. DH11]|uniref:hypothetical protein n=1 Tax=Actinoplanes sp. DH11 TaxID=2857011 RepID=UPI001E5BA819|nr:hypothetical protein [Actinoplanes sp. DH11]
MPHRSAWRALAGAAAVAAALALTTPASAAATALDIALADTTVGVGSETPIFPVLSAGTDVVLTGAGVTYRLSGDLAGVTLANPEFGDCTSVSPAELTCATPFELEVGPDGSTGLLDAVLKAGSGAIAGATGKLTATFTADGAAPVTAEAAVRVARSVDLAAGASREIRVAPGRAFDATLQVTNTSAEVVHGAGLYFYTDYAFQTTQRYQNCVYRGADRVSGCLFEQDLEPGATYRLVMPYRLRADTAAPSTSAGEFQWVTGDDWTGDDFADAARTRAGTGATLRLEPVADTRRAPQTDPDTDNNWQSVTVTATGKQGTDIAAVGARATGTAGAVVTAAVGLRNNGPATVDSSRVGEPAGVAVVTIPAGTSVATVPDGCHLAENDSEQTDPDAVQYACYTGFVFPAKSSVTWKFGLRIDRMQVNATGAVEANPACECSRFNRDIDKSNDKAKLIINPKAAEAPGGGSPAPSSPAPESPAPDDDEEPGTGTPGGGTGGGEPGLPITGPQGATVAVTGLLLVAAGAAGFLVARKRRTRFEA